MIGAVGVLLLGKRAGGVEQLTTSDSPSLLPLYNLLPLSSSDLQIQSTGYRLKSIEYRAHITPKPHHKILSCILVVISDCKVTRPQSLIQVKHCDLELTPNHAFTHHPQANSFDRNMEPIVSPTSGTPAPYGRACSMCARAKAKCVTGIGIGAKCERYLVHPAQTHDLSN